MLSAGGPERLQSQRHRVVAGRPQQSRVEKRVQTIRSEKYRGKQRAVVYRTGFFNFEHGNPVSLVRDWTVETTFAVCCRLAMFSETSQTGRYVGTVVAVGHCHFHRFRVDDRHLPSVLFIQKVRSKRHLIPREFIFYLCVSVICLCIHRWRKLR